MKIRIEKILLSQNFGTRKEVKSIIKKGFVFVNGNIIKDCSLKVDPIIDKLIVNDKEVKYKEFIYIALNKPKDYICATKDNNERTVMTLLEKYKNIKLHIVGRLDKDTTGLVILTNDGNWSHNLKSPKSNTEKEYEVVLKKPLNDLMVKKINSEFYLDNKKLKPIIFKQTSLTTCNIILTEGKYHQVKRMFHLIDNEVLNLKRIRIGNIKLNDLDIIEGKTKEFLI